MRLSLIGFSIKYEISGKTLVLDAVAFPLIQLSKDRKESVLAGIKLLLIPTDFKY